MPLSIDRPAPVDVTKTNPKSRIFLTTDDTQEELPDTAPDGSIRIIFTPTDEFAHLEKKDLGVWNQTGLTVSAQSLKLGFDMKIGGASGWLLTENLSEFNGNEDALIPHIVFTRTMGTGKAVWPFLDRLDNLIITEQLTTQTKAFHSSPYSNFPESRIVNNIRFRIGNTAPISPVEVTFYDGPDASTPILTQRILSPSEFSANSPLIIMYMSEFGFVEGRSYWLTLESDDDFSLFYDITNVIIGMSVIGYPLEEVGAMTENIIISNDLSLIFADDGIPNEPYLVNYWPFVGPA